MSSLKREKKRKEGRRIQEARRKVGKEKRKKGRQAVTPAVICEILGLRVFLVISGSSISGSRRP